MLIILIISITISILHRGLIFISHCNVLGELKEAIEKNDIEETLKDYVMAIYSFKASGGESLFSHMFVPIVNTIAGLLLFHNFLFIFYFIFVSFLIYRNNRLEDKILETLK